MRSQDTPPLAANARPDPQAAADFEHLLACWPVNHINGETRHVAFWSGWTREDALGRLERMAAAKLIVGTKPRQSPVTGEWLTFWIRPEQAYGLPPVEEPRLTAVGIHRAFTDHDAKIVRYQGEPEFVVRRRSQLLGQNGGGYRLQCEGPSPTHPRQLVPRTQTQLSLDLELAVWT